MRPIFPALVLVLFATTAGGLSAPCCPNANGTIGMSVMGGMSASADTLNYTLYGSAAGGWGDSNVSLTNPGPTLTVYRLDLVILNLSATDKEPHNWFIDVNNNSRVDANEPSSPDFNIPGSERITWNFTASLVGRYVYRCRYHPSQMTGIIDILQARPRNYTLYGSASGGWGSSNATLTNPGPTLVVDQGANVTLTLFATDGEPHNWFIDFNNNSRVDANEPSSPDFNIPGSENITWSFTAVRAGVYTYRCRYHLSTMTGIIVVRGSGGPGGDEGTAVGLVAGIMLVTIVFVLLFAVGYHVRAVRAHRRPK